MVKTGSCSFGYLLEFRLQYQTKHTNAQTVFRFCPRKKTENFSFNYMKKIKPKRDKPSPKMKMNQRKKQKLFLENRNLTFYIGQILEFSKVNIVIQFHQPPCLTIFSDFVTNQGTKARKRFENY